MLKIKFAILYVVIIPFLTIRSGYGATPDFQESTFIGVCSQVTRESPRYNPFAVHKELMDKTIAANINFTRFGFKWHTIHPSPDQWDWRVTDAVVASAAEKNLHILALITGMPNEVMDDPAANIDIWLEFVDSLTTRYSEDIFHWEIWNEPNLRNGKYWPPTELPGPFADYVMGAARVIRKNQPTATILLGGLATGQKSQPFKLWGSLFELGVLDYVDGIAYHTYQYSGKGLIEFNQRISRLVEKYSTEEKEYWITEYGVPAIDSDQFARVSYNTQTKNLMKSILVHWATGGNKFFIFSIWDKADFTPDQTEKQLRKNRTYYYGLLEKDMTPKPSYFAVKWLSAQLEQYEPMDIQDTSDGLIIRAKHKSSGNMVYFSWGSKAQKELMSSRNKKSLSLFETSETQFTLDRVKSKTIKRHTQDVSIWR